MSKAQRTQTPVTDNRQQETEIGRLLRQWREKRGLSQLDLSLGAEVSVRHISYMENGRSRATVEMIERLADAMKVPVRNRNALLTAAGFAPMYQETGLTEKERVEVDRALHGYCNDMEPFPVVVCDHEVNVVHMNKGMATIAGVFFDFDKLWGEGPRCALDLFLAPGGFKPYVLNWDETVNWFMGQVYRAAHRGLGYPAMQSALDHALSLPDVRRVWQEPGPDEVISPIQHVQIRKLGVTASVRLVYTSFGTTEDSYVRELRIVTGHPVSATAHRLLRWATRNKGRKSIEEFGRLEDKRRRA